MHGEDPASYRCQVTKQIPVPPTPLRVFLKQRNHFLITFRRDNWLWWCLSTYQAHAGLQALSGYNNYPWFFWPCPTLNRLPSPSFSFSHNPAISARHSLFCPLSWLPLSSSLPLPCSSHDQVHSAGRIQFATSSLWTLLDVSGSTYLICIMKTFLLAIPGGNHVPSLYVLCQNPLIYTAHAQTLSLYSRQTLSMLGSVGLHFEAIKPEVPKLPVGHCGG